MTLAVAIVRSALAALEPLAIRLAPRLVVPPIFIVGLPRVGSTLASLLATRHFRCAFPSNLLMATPASPVLTAMLMQHRRPFGGTDDLRSRFGETLAPSAPSQGYRFWNLYVDSHRDDLLPAARQTRRIRDTVYALQGLAHGPFINKWQRNSVRIPMLAKLFPESVFVEITRDDTDVAQSILQARKTYRRGQNDWFSVRPHSLADVKAMDIYTQIAAQITETRAIMHRDLSGLNSSRVFRFDYADICADPNRWLNALAAGYRSATGYELVVRSQVVQTLKAGGGNNLSQEERETLATAMARLCAKTSAS